MAKKRLHPLNKAESAKVEKILNSLSDKDDEYGERAMTVLERFDAFLKDGGNGLQKPSAFDIKGIKAWLDKIF